MEMKKGFVFMLDMVFGVLIALILLTSVTALISSNKSISPPLTSLQRNSQDILSTLDKGATLDSLFSQSSAQGNATLLNALNDTLPNNIGGKVEVWLCTYIGNAGNGQQGQHEGENQDQENGNNMIFPDDEDNDCTPSCAADTQFTCNTYLRASISGPASTHVGVARRVFTINQTAFGLAVMRSWYR